MYQSLKKRLKIEIEEIKDSGRYKNERIITSPQKAIINANEDEVVNFCANNYLGLASDKRIIDAAKQSLDTHGFGLASVRFICGTQDIHKKLEEEISSFLETEDTILYAAAFDANGGLFEPLFDQNDAIISDSLNHASIIDGIRLCKAARFRYNNNDMDDLEKKLKDASKYFKVSYKKFISRIHSGWSPEQAVGLQKPNIPKNNMQLTINGKKFDSIRDAAKFYGVKDSTVRNRILNGWNIKKALTTKKMDLAKKIKFNGKTFSSIRKLAKFYKVSSGTLAGKLSRGIPIKNALGI